MNIIRIAALWTPLLLVACGQAEAQQGEQEPRWNQTYDYIDRLPAIRFHCEHGVLAGSYPPGRETTEVRFDDVCAYMGHVCLCGAGGYRISRIADSLLRGDDSLLERGEYTLISGRDHAVSDVIAFVLGCSRRNDSENNQYFVDETIEAPKREYHYFIGYPSHEKAVHIVYRKHLLIGNEQMDRLWRVESAYDKNPGDVSPADMQLYRKTMADMIKEVLENDTPGLFEATVIDYDAFRSHLDRLKSGR